MTISLQKIDDTNRAAVLALSVAHEQEKFVGTINDALNDAQAYPQAKPWYRAIYAVDIPVGFVMLSWNVIPDPPSIIGPWFLWKLLIDARHQRHGYGRATVGLIAEIVRAEGGIELLTSYVESAGNPWPFYKRLGFRQTGERDDNNEVILALRL